MIEEEFAAMRGHRNRIHRYRRLLENQPGERERRYLEQRLSEEYSAFDALVAASFPLIFRISHVVGPEPSVSAPAKSATL
ncbi:hypothetical protein Q2941_44875 [Bradyrhizobium sp. UFLA05-153]